MTTSNRLWTIVVTLIAIAVVALGWLLAISPKLAEAADSDLRTEQVDAANRQHERETAKLRADFANLATISSELADLQAQLPANSNYPDFLGELDSIASEHSVQVTNVGFQGPTVLPVAGSASTSAPAAPQAGATAAPTGSVVGIPTTLTFTGSFDHLQAAAGALQAGERLFLVSGLDFATSTSTDAKAASGSSTVNVTGLLYVLTDGTTVISTPVPAPAESGPPSVSR